MKANTSAYLSQIAPLSKRSNIKILKEKFILYIKMTQYEKNIS